MADELPAKFHADPQRANMLALVRKGWTVTPSRIMSGWLQATNGFGESVVAPDFRQLLNKAAEKDAERLKKQRAEREREARKP